MQILSPSPIGFLAALSPAERAAEVQQMVAPVVQMLRENIKTLALLFGLWQVAAILSYWVASKIVAQEEGRFVNALKTYGFYILMVILLLGGGAFSVFAAESMSGPSPGLGAHLISVGLVIVFALLMLISLFAVPMKVYQIGFPQSIGFVLLAMVVQSAAVLALNKTIGRDLFGKESPLQQAFLKLAQSASAAASTTPSDGAANAGSDPDSDERIAGDATKSIAERQAALKDLYGRLDSMYQNLPPGESAARMEYDTRKARYERLLANLRQDAARGK